MLVVYKSSLSFFLSRRRYLPSLLSEAPREITGASKTPMPGQKTAKARPAGAKWKQSHTRQDLIVLQWLRVLALCKISGLEIVSGNLSTVQRMQLTMTQSEKYNFKRRTYI
jgi:hypothetical protein